MREIAHLKGGKCLSKEYIDQNSPLKWMCEKGHTWDADLQIIRQGGWCRQCAKDEVNEERLNRCKECAEKKGGKCLSKKYINSHTSLTWQCNNKHVWKTKPYHIWYNHSWCPYCSRKAIYTIDDYKKIAAKHNGKCLSTKYINGKIKLKFQCSEGHIWMARGDKIMKGQWCPVCGYHNVALKLKADISEYQLLAKKRGGKLLSPVYINALTPLEWQCSKGHTWITKPVTVKSGSWCPYCAGKTKHTLEQMKFLAALKNGKCLSAKYINAKTKLKWQCSRNHTWFAVPHSIVLGKWCRQCYLQRAGSPSRKVISE